MGLKRGALKAGAEDWLGGPHNRKPGAAARKRASSMRRNRRYWRRILRVWTAQREKEESYCLTRS